MDREQPQQLIGILHSSLQSTNSVARARLLNQFDQWRPMLVGMLTALESDPPAERLEATLKVSQMLPDLPDRSAMAESIEKFATAEQLPALFEATIANRELAPATIGAIMKLATASGDDSAEFTRAVDLLKTLSTDKSANVVFSASRKLLNIGDRRGLEPMIELLNADDGTVRILAASTLYRSTRHDIRFSAADQRAQRSQVVEQWKEWLTEESDDVELNFPLGGDILSRNRTLICDMSRQRLIEFETSGGEDSVWERKLPGVAAAKSMPNGNRVVVFFHNKRVVELDGQDKQREIYRTRDGNPSSVEVLPNGNFLIAVHRSKQHAVVEVDKDGNVVWEYKPKKSAVAARTASRLQNGNTLIAIHSSNSIIEVDKSGTTVWSTENRGSPYSAQRLANGNTLIAEFSRDRVIEIESSGRKVRNTFRLQGTASRDSKRRWSHSGWPQKRPVGNSTARVK